MREGGEEGGVEVEGRGHGVCVCVGDVGSLSELLLYSKSEKRLHLDTVLH